MKLLNTLPPFERLKQNLEANPQWGCLSRNQQIAILELTRMACRQQDQGRAPHDVRLCVDSRLNPTGGARWRFGRLSVSNGVTRFAGCMTLNTDGTLTFTTFRLPTHGGPGWIGESFQVYTDHYLNYDMIGFYNKIDRIKKEVRACVS